MCKIFVYGTLKPDESAYDKYCAPYVTQTEAAFMQGQLFHLPQGYPAMTAGDRWVTGALLTFHDESAITHIDQFEDYDPYRPAENNLYQRLLCPVFSHTQEPLGTAWAYLMSPHKVQAFGGIPVATGLWSRKRFPSI
ncbi:gamma-glutamylcyclotransferase family protein [Leptolyngbya iicbica]|uniref:Gamma-glutamylcyclotransferase n=2 Tax=Cyanophyceae TaxID=3028117 RepID=A0A4Q7EA55_9CYAN|nr:gamma-glutamylcyclotransferase family protein [Leptolyngbya sp. LK]RZM79339.1 gamma-glutamylcyclotransferase [Leptolyngbya sp. LK]